MLYVCVRDVVFSVHIVRCRAVGAHVWEVSCRCLCLVCILWQFSMLHGLQFVNAG